MALAILYDRSFESSIDDLLLRSRKDMRRRLHRLPKRTSRRSLKSNRRQTLKRLHDHLQASLKGDGRA